MNMDMSMESSATNFYTPNQNGYALPMHSKHTLFR